MDGHGGQECVDYVYTRFPFWINAVLKKYSDKNNNQKKLSDAEKISIKKEIQSVFRALKKQITQKKDWILWLHTKLCHRFPR